MSENQLVFEKMYLLIKKYLFNQKTCQFICYKYQKLMHATHNLILIFLFQFCYTRERFCINAIERHNFHKKISVYHGTTKK